MKQCSKCKESKDLELFCKDSSRKDGHQSLCKRCHSQVMINRYNELKNYTNSFKTDGCAKCKDKRLYLLDFHHLDPSIKDDTMARLTTKYSMERLANEIAKCVVLCANCHREYHHLNRIDSAFTTEKYLDL